MGRATSRIKVEPRYLARVVDGPNGRVIASRRIEGKEAAVGVADEPMRAVCVRPCCLTGVVESDEESIIGPEWVEGDEAAVGVADEPVVVTLAEEVSRYLPGGVDRPNFSVETAWYVEGSEGAIRITNESPE
jgi:hypothetical protein